MKISVLERLFHAERHRRKLREGDSSFAPPAGASFTVMPEQAPWVTSLSMGKFAPTYRDKDGYVGQAFIECPLEEEGRLIRELYLSMLTLRSVFGWSNVVKTIAEARNRMAGFGLDSKTLLVSFESLSAVVGSSLTLEEADMLMLTKGCVAEVGGVQILTVGDALPKGAAILGTLPALVGVYTRVYDHVGLTVFQADRSLVLVSDAVD